MVFYLRFIIMLSLGLLGVVLVLKILLERLFSEWDIFAEIKAWLNSSREGRPLGRLERAEDIMLEIEKAKMPVLSTRLVDQKKQSIKTPVAAQTLSSGKDSASLNPV